MHAACAQMLMRMPGVAAHMLPDMLPERSMTPTHDKPKSDSLMWPSEANSRLSGFKSR